MSEIITKSSEKVTDWALPLAREHNLYKKIDKWLNETVKKYSQQKPQLQPSRDKPRALFINHDFIDSQDRRVTQTIDIFNKRGYDVTLIAAGREDYQVDLSLNTNPAAQRATCHSIYMKDYRFMPSEDPAVSLFFFDTYSTDRKRRILEKLERIEKLDVRPDAKKRPKRTTLLFKFLWRFSLFRWVVYRAFSIQKADETSSLRLQNLDQNPNFLLQAILDKAMSLGKSYDVIVVADLPSLPAAVVLKNIFDARLIYDSHELYPEQLVYNKETRFFLSFWESYCLKYVDLAFATCPRTADFMENAYSLPKGFFRHFSNAPAFQQKAPETRDPIGPLRKAVNAGQNDPIILFHGNLGVNRNVEFIIEAFKKVKSEAKLVFLGYGDYGTRKKLAGGAKNIIFLPAVHQNELDQWVQDASAVLIPYPSIEHSLRLCAPNKLYDCIHLSVPILANSDLDYLAEVLDQYKIGKQFRTDSPENMAADIDAIVQANSFDEIRRNGDFESARRDLGWESQLPLIEEALDDAGFIAIENEDLPLAPLAKAG